MVIRGLGICVLFFFLSLALHAQCDDDVNHFCADSEIICNPAVILNQVLQMNDTTCFSQDTVIKCLGIWDINFDNPYWFRFTADGSTINLEFMIDNCMDGSSGIQYALLNDCDFDDTLECVASNGGAPFGIDGPITITEPVVPGNIYALVIDGFGGSVCDIEFTNIQGVGTVFLDPIESLSQSDFPNDTICQGAQNIVFDLDFPPGSNIEFADLFQWTLSDSGGEVWDSITLDSSLLVDFDGLEGNYSLCAFALNACDSTNVVCDSFYVEVLSDQVLDTFRFCLNELPLPPDDPNFMLVDSIQSIIPNPAVFPIINSYGCVFNQIVPLDPLSDSKRYFLDTAICGTGPVVMLGQAFTTDQMDLDILMPGMAVNGCDSLNTLDLVFLEFDGQLIADNCSADTVIISFQETSPIPTTVDSTYYIWTNDVGDTISTTLNDGKELVVSEIGMYQLEVRIEKYGVSCSNSFSVYAEPVMQNIAVSCDSIGLNDLGFVWNSVNNSTGYQVVVNSVDQGMINDTSILVSNLDPQETVSVQVTALPVGICPGPSDTIQCTTEPCPNVGITISPSDTSYCISPSLGDIQFNVQLSSHPFTATGNWSGNFIDPGTGLFNAVMAGEGTHTIYYNYSSNGCNYSDSTTVKAKLTPQISLSADTVLCIEQALEINVGGSFTSAAMFDWDEGSAILNGTNPGPFLASWSSPGSYEIMLELDQDGCISNRDTISVNVEPTLVPTSINCSSTTDSLYIEWAGIDCASNYQLLINNVDQGIQSDTFIALNGLTPDTDYTIELIALSDCICPDITITEECLTAECPVIPPPVVNCDSTLDSLFFNWNHVECATSFRIIIDGDDKGIQTDTFYSLNNLQPDQEIEIEVIAINECSCDDVVAQVSCFTQACPPIPAPLISCEGTTSSINFEWSTVWCTENYQVFINGEDQGIQSDTSFFLDDLMPEEEVSIEVVALNDCLCPDIVASENCFAKACPAIEVNITPVSDYCEDELNGEIQLEVEISGSDGSGSGYWTGVATDSTGRFNPLSAGVGKHKFYYQFREVACAYIDSVELNIFENPSANYTVAPPLCPGENLATVEIDASGGAGNYLYELGEESQMDPLFEGIFAGNHPIVVEDANGCLFDTSVIIELPEIPEIFIVGPEVVQENMNFQLELNGDVDWPDLDSISWLKNGFPVVCTGSGCDLRFEDSIFDETVYCATLHYKDRCTVVSCYPIAVKKNLNLYIPNVINPNSDVFNNQFSVFSNDQLLHVNYIRVFDRWGEMIWQAEDFVPSESANVGWDGRYNGDIVNPGVYIYTVELVDLDGNVIQLSGDLTIIR